MKRIVSIGLLILLFSGTIAHAFSETNIGDLRGKYIGLTPVGNKIAEIHVEITSAHINVSQASNTQYVHSATVPVNEYVPLSTEAHRRYYGPTFDLSNSAGFKASGKLAFLFTKHYEDNKTLVTLFLRGSSSDRIGPTMLWKDTLLGRTAFDDSVATLRKKRGYDGVVLMPQK